MPKVPPAVIAPADKRTSYLERFMVLAAIMPKIVTEAPTIPVAAANIIETNNTATNNAPRVRDIIIWTALNKRSMSPACSIIMPIKINKGTATSWSFIMVELTCRVSKKNANLLLPAIEANTKPRKIKVKEIGKPMKIENNMAANMSIPIIGFEILTSPSKVDNQSPKGNTSG